MTDNSTLPVSVGTEVFANDDIGSVKYPRVKLTWGADGTANDTDVASGKSVPTQIRTATGIPASFGAGVTDAGTVRVSLASEQVEAGEYKDVAASQASTVLGATGAAGDFLSTIIFFPESLNPGAITLQDGALTAVTIFFGGTGSVSNLVPFEVAFGHASVNGAWKIVTGAAVHVRAVGNFT